MRSLLFMKVRSLFWGEGRSLINFYPLVDHLTLGAIEAYESALRQELLYPNSGEVEKTLQQPKGKGRKGSGG